MRMEVPYGEDYETNTGIPFSSAQRLMFCSIAENFSFPINFSKNSSLLYRSWQRFGRMLLLMSRKGICSISKFSGRFRVFLQWSTASRSSCWPIQQLTQTYKNAEMRQRQCRTISITHKVGDHSEFHYTVGRHWEGCNGWSVKRGRNGDRVISRGCELVMRGCVGRGGACVGRR